VPLIPLPGLSHVINSNYLLTNLLLADKLLFRCLHNSLIALLIVVSDKSSQFYCSALLAAEWFWSLAEVEEPESLQSTHGRQVGSGLRSGESGRHTTVLMLKVGELDLGVKFNTPTNTI